jgi:hypothetical protein
MQLLLPHHALAKPAILVQQSTKLNEAHQKEIKKFMNMISH